MSALAPTPTRLVDREAELEALAAAIARGHGLVVVSGEAGAGKTRLIAEALADPRFADRRVLIG